MVLIEKERMDHPHPVCWNFVIPFIIYALGFQAIVFFIPVIIVEWFVANILINNAFHLNIERSKILQITFLSNLFSSFAGVFYTFFILPLDLNILGNFYYFILPTISFMFVLTILSELLILYLLIFFYFKKLYNDKSKNESLYSKSKILIISCIVALGQNFISYLLILIFFGLIFFLN